jgi:hypothetical protein
MNYDRIIIIYNQIENFNKNMLHLSENMQHVPIIIICNRIKTAIMNYDRTIIIYNHRK